MTVSRRAVLGLSAATALLPFGEAFALTGPLHGFVVENGTPGRAGFAVSMLVCRDPTAETAALVQLRTAQNYRRKNFGYHSTDRRKIPYFHAAMDHFVRSADVTAHTIRSVPAVAGRLKRIESRLALYKQLFAPLVANGQSIVVHLEPRTSDKREAKLTAHLQAVLGPDAKVALDGAAHGEIMNFAAVLFGAINGAQGATAKVPPSKTKTQIATVTKQALRVADLRYETLARNTKFRSAILVG